MFDTKRGPKPVDESSPEDKLYSEIGRLKIETDWLKKNWVCKPRSAHGLARARPYGSAVDVPVRAGRCSEGDGVPQAGGDVRQQHEGEQDDELRALIDEEYTGRPFYGSRRIEVFLRGRGRKVNRKRVQRLMREMGLAGMAPGPATSKPHPRHKVYPYLLRGVAVTRPNQVWSTDLTCIRLARGFAYLVAIID